MIPCINTVLVRSWPICEDRCGPGVVLAAPMVAPGESPLSAAQREFAEETGYCPKGDAIPLGSATQPGGKLVHVWAIEGDWDPADLRSNTFELEWPPRSGRRQSFPEIDRAAWFRTAEARKRILKGQALFIDRLLEALRR